MSTLSVIRAWKDPEYRGTMTGQQLAKLPAHPAGAVQISPMPSGTKPLTFKCTLNHKCIFP